VYIKKGKKEKKYSKSEGVCLYLYLFYRCFIYLFYDKIAKAKEEFNILICSLSSPNFG
jgi:hypothetical protein